MAANMNTLTPDKLNIVNQIIDQGHVLGAPDIVIEALINMANAESDFNPNPPPNLKSSATGLFQYITITWTSSWANYVQANPDSTLAQMSPENAINSPEAQIAVTYQRVMAWYNGYDQGILASVYMPGGADYSKIQQLQNDGINVTTNFINYAYFRNNTSVYQTESILNGTAYTSSNLAAVAALVAGSSASNCNGSAQNGGVLGLQLSYELGNAQNQIIDPLVISINGQAVTTTSQANGAYVDYRGTGFAEQSSWFSSNAGILVDVTNPAGTLNNGFTIIGSGTTNQNGNVQGQAGFTQLAALDTNHDGVINASDTGFSQIEVWVGSNGQAGSGQLQTLAQAGITSISLNSTTAYTTDANGDKLLATSTVTNSNGTTSTLSDMNMAVNTSNTIDKSGGGVNDPQEQVYHFTGDTREIDALSRFVGAQYANNSGWSTDKRMYVRATRAIAMVFLLATSPNVFATHGNEIVEYSGRVSYQKSPRNAKKIPESLCDLNEEIISYACTLANNKVVSVCASKNLSPNTGYIVYRYGLPDKVEFVYPKPLQKPEGIFSYSDNWSQTESQSTLSFFSKPYKYTVFHHSYVKSYKRKNFERFGRAGVSVRDGKKIIFQKLCRANSYYTTGRVISADSGAIIHYLGTNFVFDLGWDYQALNPLNLGADDFTDKVMINEGGN